MSRLLLPALLLAAASAFAAPQPVRDQPPSAPDKDVVLGPHPFDCPPPKGWTVMPEPDGMSFIGPQDAHGVPAQINVRWVRPGAGGEPSAEAYIARQARPLEARIPGWSVGKPGDAEVAGRKARRVERESSEHVPPSSLKSVEVPMKEEHVAVPASQGYFVLLYYAPRSLFAKHRPAFQKTLDGFAPRR